jgi:hypothetical protein
MGGRDGNTARPIPHRRKQSLLNLVAEHTTALLRKLNLEVTVCPFQTLRGSIPWQ